MCPDRFQGGPSVQGRKGHGSRAWTSGESEARGWEREFLPERGCGQVGLCRSQGLCREGPERRPDCCHPPQPGWAPRGTLTGFVLPEPGKLFFRALPVLSPVLVRPRSPPGNSCGFSESKPPAPAPPSPLLPPRCLQVRAMAVHLAPKVEAGATNHYLPAPATLPRARETKSPCSPLRLAHRAF